MGIGCGSTAIVIASAFAWPVLTSAFSAFGHVRHFVTFSLLVLVGMLIVLLAVTRVRNAKVVGATLAALTVFEAALYFSVPYLSYPLKGRIDSGLTEFLRSNAGFQRVVATDGGQFRPNYGSYFGISQLNWADLPVPRVALQYVMERLDPYVYRGRQNYLPDTVLQTGEERTKRKILFAQRLDDYARVGVKYVLSSDDINAYPVISVGSEWRYPIPLESGQRVEIVLPFTGQEKDDIAGLSVVIGTYSGKSNGHLRIELCRLQDCVSGSTDLASTSDNSPATVRFDRALAVHRDDKLHIVLEKMGGDHAVALWTGPLAVKQAVVQIVEGPPSLRPASAPVLQFLGSKSRLVYRGKNTNVFQLSGVRPYFNSVECKLTPMTHDKVVAKCPSTGHLVRLELAMPGWRAFVAEREVSVRTVDHIFQEIDLPKGVSTVDFVYAPTGVRPAIGISIGTLVAILTALVLFPSRHERRRDRANSAVELARAMK